MTNSEEKKMMTLVFMDLESTGLPTPGNYPRITELSMIAIDTVSLTTFEGSPRVRNKLTLCMYPMRTVSLGAFRITGLHNDNLFYQKDFDKGTADLINLFLERLAPPVCLVAHNGLHYDYPLLLAEYKRVGRCLPKQLYVADSLPMFRILDPDDRMKTMSKYEESEEELQHEDDGDGENLNTLAPPQNAFKKDVLQNHKNSVKRKLFVDDKEDCINDAPGAISDLDKTVFICDDDDTEEDAMSIASDATEDYYGTLPGIEDVMADVEESQTRTTSVETEWDEDDLDDESLLSGSQQILEDIEQSQNSGASQMSRLSQNSNCSSLLLTPPDSERKRSPPRYDLDAPTSKSRNTVIPSTPVTLITKTVFKKFVMPSPQTTPKKDKEQNGSTSSNRLTPSQTPRFQKYVMNMPSPSQTNSSTNASQSGTRNLQQTSQTRTWKSDAASNVTPSSSQKYTQSITPFAKSSGPPKRKFVKFVMPTCQANDVTSEKPTVAISSWITNPQSSVTGSQLQSSSQKSSVQKPPSPVTSTKSTDGLKTEPRPGPSGVKNCCNNSAATKSDSVSRGKGAQSEPPSQRQVKQSSVPTNNNSGVLPEQGLPWLPSDDTRAQSPRKSYCLKMIYYRIFWRFPPVSHKAEDDAVTLMRICYRRAQDVCDWINANAGLFSVVVEPMYEKKFNSKGLSWGKFPYQL